LPLLGTELHGSRRNVLFQVSDRGCSGDRQHDRRVVQ
jgi:hypothetical protein